MRHLDDCARSVPPDAAEQLGEMAKLFARIFAREVAVAVREELRQPEPDQGLTRKQAAAMLGISTTSLWRLAQSGALKASPHTGTYSRRAVEELLRSR